MLGKMKNTSLCEYISSKISTNLANVNVKHKMKKFSSNGLKKGAKTEPTDIVDLKKICIIDLWIIVA